MNIYRRHFTDVFIYYPKTNLYLYFCSYVQHILEQNEENLYKLLSSEECFVFVAGNAKDMPTAVKNVFIKIFEKNKNLKNTSSINTLDMMETKGFYQTETWN